MMQGVIMLLCLADLRTCKIKVGMRASEVTLGDGSIAEISNIVIAAAVIMDEIKHLN